VPCAPGFGGDKGFRDPTKLAAAQAKASQDATKAQIASYGDMAGAAAGFFDQNSKGYKALHTVEQSFRAFEVAMAFQTMVKKRFFTEAFVAANVSGNAITAASAVACAAVEIPAKMAVAEANAIAGVANQANGDPYSAFPRMTAMGAIMVALGLAVGSFSGGAQQVDIAKNAQAKQGTGTVLGDSTAKSASVVKALELLGSNSDIALKYSSQMVMSLKNIETGIGGLANIIYRTAGMTTGANFGIQQGVLSKNTGDPLTKGLFGFDDSSFTKNIPIIGGIVNKLQSLWGNTTQTQTPTRSSTPA
jgi:hypothetical protein